MADKPATGDDVHELCKQLHKLRDRITDRDQIKILYAVHTLLQVVLTQLDRQATAERDKTLENPNETT